MFDFFFFMCVAWEKPSHCGNLTYSNRYKVVLKTTFLWDIYYIILNYIANVATHPTVMIEKIAFNYSKRFTAGCK